MKIDQGEGDNARLLSLGAPVNAQIQCVEAHIVATTILQTLSITDEDPEWGVLTICDNEEMVLCCDA